MEFDDMFDSMFESDAAFWQEPDFLLSNIVSLMANKMDSQLGVTLLVRGLIMTGTLSGEKEYLTAVNNMFKSIAKDSLVKPSKEDLEAVDEAFIFDELTEDTYPNFAPPDKNNDYSNDDDDDFDDDDELELDDIDVAQIRHLHLKDPVIIYPQSALSLTESPLPIIRIRLTEVDGWMMGRMAVMPMDDDDDSQPFNLPNDEIRH
jgi:hypothetical protein